MSNIKELLYTLSEPAYADFASRLLPSNMEQPLLGVRLPVLRKIARELARQDLSKALEQLTDDSFEEKMLQGMVIGYSKAPLEQILNAIRSFLPKIDNWSICDSFCSGLKIARIHPYPVWEFLEPFFESEHPYTVRFAVVMLLNHYRTREYLAPSLAQLISLKNESLTVQMATAWALSMYYVHFPDETFQAMKKISDSNVRRLTVRKICESHQASSQQKEMLKGWRRECEAHAK
ncbi:DNA alkylation repair protein [uncultured Ruthenibacterium sp.]|uniref:DNA alkylation repair protein n=1 Tax=uncultured Ruthenibacterium sp. TaxID=1905347 RepID=UPI00349EBB0A